MKDFKSIKKEIAGMSKLALEMWQTTHEAFMQHDLDLLSQVLEKESKLNDLEKELTGNLIELGRVAESEDEKNEISIYVDVTGDLELIGDYCKDILERVEIKIEERLLFSEEAVKEYNELYDKTESALSEVVFSLEKDNPGLLKEILKKDEHIDPLVDEYRKKHNQRLIAGVCTPMACNMFLNMLDFTAAVYYHAKKIARNLIKIKKS